jgi:hypothetical protein
VSAHDAPEAGAGAGSSLEYVFEDRYRVFLGGLRIGEIFGGRGVWLAHDINDELVGRAPTRMKAAALIAKPSAAAEAS